MNRGIALPEGRLALPTFVTNRPIMRPFRFAFAALFALSAVAAQASTPSHLYTLNGTFADALGGPSLVANGGTLGATGYTFAANEGLSVAGALQADTYTIDTRFSFDATSGYRKIIDFSALASDAGFYNLSSQLNFYPVVTGPTVGISDGTTVRVTLSRDGSTGLVSGYLNGALEFSFTDTSGLATFNAAGGVANFYVDDFATGQREAAAGFVDYIAIYDSALAASEIGTLTPAVPEPAGWAMLLAGMGVLGWVTNRRR